LAVRNEINPDLASFDYQPVHNLFLLVWAEIGILGSLLFLSLPVYLIILNYFIERDKNITSSYFSWPLILTILVMMSVDHWYWSLHFGILVFWLVLGLMARGINDSNLGSNLAAKGEKG